MNCRICNNDNLDFFYSQGKNGQFRYFKCRNCSLVNLDITGLDINTQQEKYEFNFVDPRETSLNSDTDATYSYLRRKIKKRGNYLDIGCGNGALLYFALQDGWQAEGIEISEKLADKVRESLGVKVIKAQFPEMDLPDGHYDLVTLRHVLEHIPDSIKALTKINNLLKPGGYALMEFPNIMGISFALKRTLSKLGLYKKKYGHEYVPGHCNEFSFKSYEYLISKTGFELIEWQTYSKREWMNSLYGIFKIGTKARALIRKIT